MNEQEKIVITNFHGTETVIAADALPDYFSRLLSHLQALAVLLSGQDDSCNSVTAESLDLNRALVDEICTLYPYLATRQYAPPPQSSI